MKTPICPCSSGCIFRDDGKDFHIKHIHSDINLFGKRFDYENDDFAMTFGMEIEGYGRLIVWMDSQKAVQMAHRVLSMGPLPRPDEIPFNNRNRK